MRRVRVSVPRMTTAKRWAARTENGDDRHGGACPACGYFDTLRKIGGLRGAAVHACREHVLAEHEAPG